MTVLITGGSGFIGLALAERLMAQGEAVLLFDRAAPPAPLLERLGQGGAAPGLVLGDIRSAADVDAALALPGVDRVVHAAAITSDAERERREPLPVVEVNIGGTVNLVQRCALAAQQPGRALRRVLVMSSVAVYGIGAPRGERYEEARDATLPAALYGISKLAAEQAALRLGELHGMDLRVARLGPVFGPWEYATGVRDALSPHAQVLAAALAGQHVLLPRAMRADWIYSRDAAAALAALLGAPGLRHAVYNVGGQAMSDLPQWCGLLAGALAERRPGWRWRLAAEGEAASVRYGLPVDRAPLDTQRLLADTAGVFTRSLAQALQDQLAWHDARSGLSAPQTINEDSPHATT